MVIQGAAAAVIKCDQALLKSQIAKPVSHDIFILPHSKEQISKRPSYQEISSSHVSFVNKLNSFAKNQVNLGRATIHPAHENPFGTILLKTRYLLANYDNTPKVLDSIAESLLIMVRFYSLKDNNPNSSALLAINEAGAIIKLDEGWNSTTQGLPHLFELFFLQKNIDQSTLQKIALGANQIESLRGLGKLTQAQVSSFVASYEAALFRLKMEEQSSTVVEYLDVIRLLQDKDLENQKVANFFQKFMTSKAKFDGDAASSLAVYLDAYISDANIARLYLLIILKADYHIASPEQFNARLNNRMVDYIEMIRNSSLSSNEKSDLIQKAQEVLQAIGTIAPNPDFNR